MLTAQLADAGLSDEEAKNADIYTIVAFEGGLVLAKAHNDTPYLMGIRDQVTQHLKAIIHKNGNKGCQTSK